MSIWHVTIEVKAADLASEELIGEEIERVRGDGRLGLSFSFTRTTYTFDFPTVR